MSPPPHAPPPASLLGSAEAPPPTVTNPRLRLLIPLVVAFAFFLEQLDQTIITTAIPDMALGLHETPLRLNLALTSYILSLAVFIPVSGWVADRVGMRRTFVAAIALFMLGSAACGSAPDLAMLVAARVLQGFGGAMLTPVGRLILLRSFPRSDLVTAMSYVSIPSVIGPMLGPLAGGVIATYANWRWIFYVNLPFGALGMWLAWRYVQDTARPPPERFDWPGFFLCGMGLAMLQFGIEAVSHPILSPIGVAGLFLAAAALLVFYAWYARRHANAALDLSQWRRRSFRVSIWAGGITRVGISAAPFMLPLMFQLGFGLSAIESGSLTFVASLGTLVIRPLTAYLLRRLGFDRMLPVNTILAAATLAGFYFIGAETPHWIVLAYLLVFGMVRNLQFNALQTLTFADMPPASLSKATSLAGVVQQMVTGLGVSVSATLLGLIAGAGAVPRTADFHTVFVAVAGITLLSLPGFLSLTRHDGAQVSGHMLL